MKKRGFLRQRIKGSLCAQNGQIHWFMGIFFILMLLLLISTGLQLKQYHITGSYMEDALAAANLASAVVDLQEYGISHTIRIENPSRAYELFCHALKGNLNLDETWQCRNRTVMAGPVRVVRYTVYNVSGDTVQIFEVKEDGRVIQSSGNLWGVRAPDGTLIENTSVYSEITCAVKGIWDIEVIAKKGKLVDIVSEGNGL